MAQPICLHPENPHYFLWRDRPTVLITSTEHYGSVLNRAIDYRKYLATLASYGFNLTRTFSGAYCEAPGAFSIRDNNLAPAAGDLLCPWARSETPGYANGGNKFDLTRWDPAYFKRLRDFIAEAGKRGIVVEFVPFCTFYDDSMWNLSPMNAANNVNGIGDVPRERVHTLEDAALTAVQEAMLRTIVTELNGFDNLYYEICNEPYVRNIVTDAWQAHMAGVIVDTEASLPNKHLIAQNIANGSEEIVNPDPRVSIFNFHYAKPPTAVTVNYGLGRPIADDETGFAGNEPEAYRLEGWDFMIAGGAVYDNLDYSFTVGHEDGSAEPQEPGGGGPVLHRQLAILSEFMNSLDFIHMAPDNSVLVEVAPVGDIGAEVTGRALVQPGRTYAVYLRGGSQARLALKLPAGEYRAEWVNTKTGQVDGAEQFQHAGGARELVSPAYEADIALRVQSV
jgi:hypothetical protein